ncbi:hypothetical protein [uncultured Shewanella sp.]|uniref:hypothetical protein n=1 Tax=uncultured Shewanella sp. TaxID=173975 RepID=UPI00263320A8|nr:hypothetical protein [uncultured Shewanella sp.]
MDEQQKLMAAWDKPHSVKRGVIVTGVKWECTRALFTEHVTEHECIQHIQARDWNEC